MRYKPHKKNLITPEALEGMSAKEVQEKFKISQATAYRWLAEAERKTMFELLGNETEHEAAVKRVINLQEEMIENFYRINELETEIKHLKKENNMLDEAREYWKLEMAKYYNCTNLIANLSGATLTTKETIKTKKKPTTK